MNKEPVIFLDFDGVLNSVMSAVAHVGEFDDTCGPTALDPVAVKLIGRLATITGAKVVVSSTWRILHTLEELKAIIMNYSRPLADAMVDVTSRSPGAMRGEEIQMWLIAHPHETILIIDDDSDMLPSQMPSFVQTEGRTGFGMNEYIRSLRVLQAIPGAAHELKCLKGYEAPRREQPTLSESTQLYLLTLMKRERDTLSGFLAYGNEISRVQRLDEMIAEVEALTTTP